MQTIGDNFIYFIGCYALTCYLYDNLKNPLQLLILKLFQYFGLLQQQSLKEKYSSWAAITGATDGIGKAYARELASHGLNIVLISRSSAKLQKVSNEIITDFTVQTRIIVADFTHGQRVYEHIETQMDELRVGIWVNNVGQFTSLPGCLAFFDADELAHVIQTNVMAVTMLSRLILYRMSRAGIKGIIVNISSGLEVFPAPLAAVYAASKAYTRSFTLALQYEARPLGVRVQLVSPGFVLTKMNSHASCMQRRSIFVPTAKEFACWAIEVLHKDLAETTGYYWHGIQMAILKLLPMRLWSFVWYNMVKLLADKLKTL